MEYNTMEFLKIPETPETRERNALKLERFVDLGRKTHANQCELHAVAKCCQFWEPVEGLGNSGTATYMQHGFLKPRNTLNISELSRIVANLIQFVAS